MDEWERGRDSRVERTEGVRERKAFLFPRDMGKLDLHKVLYFQPSHLSFRSKDQVGVRECLQSPQFAVENACMYGQGFNSPGA